MYYCFSELMYRIFKCANIQGNSLIQDKELNILIYELTSCVIICRSYELLKRSTFLLTL